MCGRVNITDDPFIRELMAALGVPVPLKSHFNVAPTDTVPLIIEERAKRAVHSMRWWLTPSWAPEVSSKYSMFNAKSETLAQSRAFRTPFHRQRGILPASSFIEWQKADTGKQPWCIQPTDQAIAFAALWDRWEKHGNFIESCTIITTAAPPEFTHIHHRFPVMLTLEECEVWLNADSETSALTPFFRPEIKYQMEMFPISTAINNANNKDDRSVTPTGQREVLGAG